MISASVLLQSNDTNPLTQFIEHVLYELPYQVEVRMQFQKIDDIDIIPPNDIGKVR
jgi:hypothetical protein